MTTQRDRGRGRGSIPAPMGRGFGALEASTHRDDGTGEVLGYDDRPGEGENGDEVHAELRCRSSAPSPAPSADGLGVRTNPVVKQLRVGARLGDEPRGERWKPAHEGVAEAHDGEPGPVGIDVSERSAAPLSP